LPRLAQHDRPLLIVEEKSFLFGPLRGIRNVSISSISSGGTPNHLFEWHALPKL
jgi:hypothetical protein